MVAPMEMCILLQKDIIKKNTAFLLCHAPAVQMKMRFLGASAALIECGNFTVALEMTLLRVNEL